jgi:hypothetical protein
MYAGRRPPQCRFRQSGLNLDGEDLRPLSLGERNTPYTRASGATRYEKTDKCFAAIINLVATVLWTR